MLSEQSDRLVQRCHAKQPFQIRYYPDRINSGRSMAIRFQRSAIDCRLTMMMIELHMQRRLQALPHRFLLAMIAMVQLWVLIPKRWEMTSIPSTWMDWLFLRSRP